MHSRHAWCTWKKCAQVHESTFITFTSCAKKILKQNWEFWQAKYTCKEKELELDRIFVHRFDTCMDQLQQFSPEEVARISDNLILQTFTAMAEFLNGIRNGRGISAATRLLNVVTDH